MCGIAGIVGGPLEPLEAMAAAMAHRGPDGQAVWRGEGAGLAFRRLAIIDLDERSMQPLHHDRWHLVFNGEIYDYLERRAELEALGHAFRTAGDGEVLLRAWAQWGSDALNRVDGMFALAVYDDVERELTLACDPFGEKPLFWVQAGGRLCFASDLTALPGPRRAREAALAPYLGRTLMPPIDESFLDGVQRLPGGHLLRFRAGRAARTARYWDPAAPVAVPGRYEDAVAELRGLLGASVRRRLRADVAVGTSLSGGVDSSVVASLSQAPERHVFTARFPGFARDEWHYAQLVAERAGVTAHHAVEPAAGGLLAELEHLVAAHQEPVGGSSVYAQWCVMRAARAAGVTVLLDGQGADELFGGYAGSNGWALRAQGAPAALAGLTRRRDRRAVLEAVGSERLPGWVARRHRAAAVTPYASAAVAAAAAAVPVPAAGGRDPLQRELLRQAVHTSMPALLRYADRNSMAHSREVRLPFLDRRVASFALSAPAEFLYRGGVRKALLRDAVRDLVPAAVMDRTDKVGYETPQASWLATPPAVARIAEVLLDGEARSRGLYDAAVIEADARAGRWRDPAGIWRALNLELWLRGVVAARPLPAAVA